MKKRNMFLLGMLVMVLVFGMTVVGCATYAPKQDQNLLGVWSGVASEIFVWEFTFSETGYVLKQNGEYSSRGTWVTPKDKRLTLYQAKTYDKTKSQWKKDKLEIELVYVLFSEEDGTTGFALDSGNSTYKYLYKGIYTKQ